MKSIIPKRALFLALCLCCIFASCSACGKTPSEENTALTSADVTETAAETEVRENLPDKNFEGKSFRIVCDEGTLAPKDFIAEELDGEILNDAVYNRNAIIEQRFNVKIEAEINGYGESFVKNLNTFILADDDAYDVAMGMNNVYSGITTMVYDGRFIDWNQLQYVDLTKPWWDSNVIRDICFGNKIFCMTGDFNPSTLGNTRIILFNKNLFTDMNLEFPYQKVLDGAWTYDEFMAVCTQGESDLNGDGKMNYTDDRYGYTGWYCDTSESIFYGMGGSYTVKDTGNMPVFNLNNEKTFDIIDKLIAIFKSGNGGWLNTVGWGHDITIFSQGRALMLNSRFILLNNFRDMKDDFGIIPHPKMNEQQNGYLESVDAVCTMCYIPITNSDLEFTAIILEAMAAESYRSVMPAYYNVVLQTKYTRDNDSEAMIDLIKNSRSYPLQLKTLTINLFTPFITDQSNGLASFYEKNENQGLKELEAIIAAYS